jgi:hypothetical protein
VGIHNVELDAALRQGRVTFEGRWNAAGKVSLLARIPVVPPLSAEMTGRMSGEYTVASAEGRATVTVPSLRGDVFTLKPLSVSFLFKDQKLEAKKVYDKLPSDISFTWDRAAGSIEASFTGENFPLGDMITLTGGWKAYDSLLGLHLSGGASLEKKNGGDLVYAVDLIGAFPDGVLHTSGFGRGAASFEVAASGDAREVTVREFRVDSPWGNVGYRGSVGFSPLSPNGLLSVENLGIQGDERPDERMSADFSITAKGPEIHVSGDNLTAGQVTLSALDGVLLWEDDGFSFALSALRFRDRETIEKEFPPDVRLSNLSLEGSVDYTPGNVQASLMLEAFPVRDMIELARPFGVIPSLSDFVFTIADKLSVTTEVFFTTDYEHLLYNAPRFVAVYEGSSDILAAASLSGTDQRIRLEAGHISWGSGTADMAFSADFSDADDISFSIETAYRDLAYTLDGSIMDGRFVSMMGSYGLQVYMNEAGMNSWSLYAGGENIPVPSGEQYAQLSFALSLMYDSAEFWSLNVSRFELTDLATPGSSLASLRFTGTANEEGADIPDLIFDDGKGVLQGNIGVFWEKGYQNLRASLNLRNGDNKEWYELEASYGENGGGKLDVGVSGEDMQFARFFANARNTVVSGKANLSWEQENDFSASAEIASLVFRFGDEDVKVSASAFLDPTQFLVSGIRLNYGGIEALVPFFSVDRLASLAETSAEVHGAAAGRAVDMAFRGHAEFTPLGSWNSLGDALAFFHGSLVMDTARYGDIETEEPFSFEFSSESDGDGSRIILTGGPRNMIRFQYSFNSEGSGDFYAALSSPSAIRGSFTGSIDSNVIDARTSDLYVDLGSLWRFIPPQNIINFPGGIVTASVRITGPLRDPEFYGSAKATSVRIQVPEYITEDIRPVPVAFSITGSEMSFGPVDASVGKGSGVVSAWCGFDRWVPRNFTMDIVVPPDDPIPFGFDISGVLASGNVSGKLNLALEESIFSILGDLTAHNTEISLNTEEISAQEPPPVGEITTVTDIRIQTGKRVEFFYPTVEFPMLQAYADLGTGIHITSDMVSRRFTLQGDVQIRSGEIFYLERNFYIREGTLYFNENELQFAPRISARAEIRDQSDEGAVTISMIIDNAPLQSFTPRFESNPALSQTEIYTLLGQNPQERTTDLIISTGADLLTQFTVMRGLQREVRNFLNLDMLDRKSVV